MPRGGSGNIGSVPVPDNGESCTEGGDTPKTSMVVPSDASELVSAAVSRLQHEINGQLLAAGLLVESMLRGADPRQTATDLQTCFFRINHILRVAGKRSQLEPLDLQRIDIADLIGVWTAQLNRIYGARSFITLKASDENIHISADPDCIFEILLNLVRNAIDSMNDCPNRKNDLQIVVRKTEGCVSIDVIDNGTGFAENVLRREGGKFISTKSGKGHGIGLNTCHDLLIRMKASFQVQNNPAPREGATVSMIFRITG